MRVILRVVALALVLPISTLVFADEPTNKLSDAKQSPGAAPSAAARSDAKPNASGDAKTPTDARQLRLTKPWRDMPSLSEDQKRQINQIHRKSVQDVKAIEQRERDDIMALLNDQQKMELRAMMEKDAADKKAKAVEKSKAGAKTSVKNADSNRADAASEDAEADADADAAAGTN